MPSKVWSHSQAKELLLCERRWFLSHGLRPTIRSRDKFLRQLAFLKKLRPSFMWRGELVHEVIAGILRGARKSRVWSLSYAEDTLNARFAAQWKESLRRVAELDPKTSADPPGPILFEHYYAEQGERPDLSEIAGIAEHQLQNFYSWARQQSLFEKVANASQTWIDESSYFPSSPGFPVGEFKFVTKVDLAFSNSSEFRVYDWKCSVSPKEKLEQTSGYRQLLYYSLWPHLEMDRSLEEIGTTIVYLGNDSGARVHDIRLPAYQVDDLMAEAELMVSAAREFLDKEMGFRLEDFDWSSSPKVCRSCSFQQVCREELGS